MKTSIAALFATAGLCLAALVSTTSTADAKCHGTGPEARMECKVIALLNEHRARNGRKKLRFSNQCYRMAKSHARTMKKHKKLSHEVVRGQDPNVRANKFGLGKARTDRNRKSKLRYSGENLSRYHPTPEDAMSGWRWSIWGHNGNMLRADHTHVGVGVAIARDKKGKRIKGEIYWAQAFCNPRR